MDQKLERILVGIDPSEESLRAAERAAWLPHAEEAVVTIFHVIPRDLQLAPLLEALAEDETPALLEGGVQHAREAAASAGRAVHVTTASCPGVPFVEIVRRAREDRTDLIVVGRRSTRSFGDGFIGSTAARVVRKARSPVLVVTDRPTSPYVRPLVAVDLSPTSKRAVALALRVVDPGVTTVDIVHARSEGEPEEAARQSLVALLATLGSAGIAWNLVIRDGDPRKVIVREAVERRSDLLVIGTHGRTAVAQLLIGSVAEAVVRAAPCDILVARPETHSFAMP